MDFIFFFDSLSYNSLETFHQFPIVVGWFVLKIYREFLPSFQNITKMNKNDKEVEGSSHYQNLYRRVQGSHQTTRKQGLHLI